MCLKTFECQGCGTNLVLDIPMTAPNSEQFSQTEWCSRCQKTSTFQRVYAPVAFGFGLMTRKYTGQQAAVEGWGGVHSLEYPNPKSDLITGRAQEAAQRIQPAVVE
jgi:hypothetical protein